MQWAFEQNNLGDVHWNRGSYGGGNAEYQKAIDSSRTPSKALPKPATHSPSR